MNQGRYVFNQLCDFLPKTQFDWFVKKYQGNKYVKSFTCWNHLLVMIFAQLTHRESLRDLTATLNAHKSKINRLGFGESVTRSNLSKANEQREAKIFEDMAYLMVKTARDLRVGIVEKDFFYKGDVYAFDSTTISLCLNVFWWSKLHHDKGGVKMHTLYDVKTDVPSFFLITNADIHDSQVMDKVPYEPGAMYVFDRAYMDTTQLFAINLIEAFFVVREKRRMAYGVIEDRQCDNCPDSGIMADQTVEFRGCKTRKQYAKPIRRIVFYDKEGNQTFVFYTNNFHVPAEDIAIAYKYRWRVELFFKWMKQHLHIKEFYGTTENAVKIQLYSTIVAYCLVAIVERKMKLNMDMYDLLRILSVSLLDKIPLKDLLGQSKTTGSLQSVTELTLNLF